MAMWDFLHTAINAIGTGRRPSASFFDGTANHFRYDFFVLTDYLDQTHNIVIEFWQFCVRHPSFGVAGSANCFDSEAGHEVRFHLKTSDITHTAILDVPSSCNFNCVSNQQAS